jgi:hypothetical protein
MCCHAITCHERTLAALGRVGRRDGPTFTRAALRLLVRDQCWCSE